MTDLIYRFLENDEHPRLVPLFNRRGFAIPHPKMSTAAVAEVPEGGLVGAWILQLVPHIEPLVILPEWEGKVSVERLFHMLDKRAQAMRDYAGGYIIHADNPAHEHVFEDRWGLERKDWRVFRKEF